MEVTYKQLAKRINRWQMETAIYRTWNIVFFLSAKIAIPTASALIAANLSVAASGTPFISNNVMIGLGIVIGVLSGLDSFFNPGLQKYRAHRNNIELSNLEEKLKIGWSISEDDKSKSELLSDISDKLNEMLGRYAKEGYGNNGT